MRLQIPDGFRVALGKKYLQCANRLTFVKGASFVLARELFQEHTKDSEKAYIKTRPPEGVKIEYLYFRLIEAFFIDGYGQLVQSVNKLFPDVGDEFASSSFSTSFMQNMGGVTGGSWLNLGYIVRKRGQGLFTGLVREMSELPEEVKYIHVELHVPFPSLFIMTFDVYLDESATKQLSELQNLHYIPELRFKHVIPHGWAGGGFSQTLAESVMRREILKWQKQFQGKVEGCLKPFINGYFTQQSSDKVARLPIIQVYDLIGTSLQQDWMEAGRDWLSSLGFNHLQYNSYSDGRQMFLVESAEPESRERTTRSVYRIIVLREQYLATIRTEMFGGHEKSAIVHFTSDTLTAMLPYIAIFEILRFAQISIEKLRRKTFSSMRRSRFLSVNKLVKLNDAILQAAMFLDRMKIELKQEEARLSEELREIKDLKGSWGSSKEQGLDDLLRDSIAFRMELLDRHTSFVANWLSQYLILRNTSTTYLLAIVAGVTAIISVMLALAAQ